MALDFNEVLANDVKDVFLTEFSVDAIYKSGTNIKQIRVQFFEDSLDKMETLYSHAICDYKDVSYITNNDSLEVNGVVYGVVDFQVDETQTVTNLFLQKV
jgi:hypothetical protein